jgi:peptidoglycan/LPS O-acetylase OafA/YrhL
LLIQWKLPGTFETNPNSYSVNQSLWTLPMEFVGYVIVLVVGILIAFSLSRLVLVLLPVALMVQEGFLLATVGEYGAGIGTGHRSDRSPRSTSSSCTWAYTSS